MKKISGIVNKSLLLLMVSIGMLFNSSMAVSPSTYAKEKQLTLRANHITIQQALAEIQKQSEFDFFYRNVDIERIQKKVSVSFKDQTIYQVLPGILAGTNLGYKVMAKDIVIFPLPDAGEASEEGVPQQQEVTGRVTDAETGDPLPGVNIVIEGTTRGSTTDMDGNYSIRAPGDATLVFLFVRFQRLSEAIGGL